MEEDAYENAYHFGGIVVDAYYSGEMEKMRTTLVELMEKRFIHCNEDEEL